MTRAPRSIGAGIEELRTDQAPPLAVPMSFFVVAPLAMMAAGLLLVVRGAEALASRHAPAAVAFTHLGTLGFLGSTMLGALYQMAPVVAGAPVPWPRLAHAVHALYLVGGGSLVAAFALGGSEFLAIGPALLGVSLLLFFVPVGVALVRAPTHTETVWGMRLALASLAAVALLGGVMALARGGLVGAPATWSAWVAAHATLGGAGWVGTLVCAVSWQVVPMFYLTPELPSWSRSLTVGSTAFTLLAVPGVLFVGGGPADVFAAAAPVVACVWFVHPVLVARALRARRRRRVDGSARFWWLAMALAPLIPPLAAAALKADDLRFSVLLGFVAVWGWGGGVVHGMLTRIAPFLVWFHRYAAHVGLEPVPAMRDLFPDARVQRAWVLHTASVASGAIAIVTRNGALARGTGLLFVLTAAQLAAGLSRTVAPPGRASAPTS